MATSRLVIRNDNQGVATRAGDTRMGAAPTIRIARLLMAFDRLTDRGLEAMLPDVRPSTIRSARVRLWRRGEVQRAGFVMGSSRREAVWKLS